MVVSNVASGSVATLAGIRRGTVILEVERQPVSSPEEFLRAVEAAAPNGRVLLLVITDNVQRYVALSW